MKIGGLYKLNPRYDHIGGKHLYEIDTFEKHNDTDISALPSKTILYSNDIVMLVEQNLFYSHIPAYRDTRFIKILLNDIVYLFPHDIYRPDIFITV